MSKTVKIYLCLLAVFAIGFVAALASHTFAATVLLTATSDTIGTFRTNVNTSLTNLNNAIIGFQSVTSIGPTGQTQTGPAVIIATSSTPFNGLTASTTVTGSGNILTLTNTLAGVLGIGGGGTGSTTSYANGLLFSNGTTYRQAAHTGADILDYTNNSLGIGTTSPFATLSVNTAAGAEPFVVGSTTKSYLGVTQGGQITLSESKAATSTAMVFDWDKTPPLITLNMGTAAYTITFINATTTKQAGSRKIVETCAPGAGTPGSPTFKDLEYLGAAPTYGTTVNLCDETSIYIGSATSTAASPVYKMHGAASTGFQ